ncbi:MAG: hypothetical protein ACP5EQ_01960 [Candidatus Cloacimonadia bacterium]
MFRRRLSYILIFIGTLCLLSCGEQRSKEQVWAPSDFWNTDGYFQQDAVRTPSASEQVIRARIRGKWQKFTLQDLPPEFMKWNTERRIETLDRFRQMAPPELAGPHNGIVASYGAKRFDTQFKLNNAVKGMGFLPKPERLPEIIALLDSTKDASFQDKLDNLQYLYENAEEIFDLNKQVSLELYSTPEFETQTFLNQMTNPISTIVFLDIPSYKLKTIVRLLHPDDPHLTEYERNVVRYVNDVHSYFHGEFPRDYITAIYYVVEVYDNSPGSSDALGRRIAP